MSHLSGVVAEFFAATPLETEEPDSVTTPGTVSVFTTGVTEAFCLVYIALSCGHTAIDPALLSLIVSYLPDPLVYCGLRRRE